MIVGNETAFKYMHESLKKGKDMRKDIFIKTEEKHALSVNRKNYENLYTKKDGFLRYPADWIIRFHNMYLKKNLPKGRVLDFGCGGGNNSIFFIEQGYEVWGVDVAKPSLELIKMNLQSRGHDIGLAKRFSIIPTNCSSLPFDRSFFDLIISNQVLYYLPTEKHIKSICKELSRCLRPGGIVFFTMMGPKNYYITYHAKRIHNGRVYEIRIDTPGHRLQGLTEFIYLVKDRDELCKLFSEFEEVSTGYIDESMFDLKSAFHWLFIGRKPDKK